jgi:membrane dipeptidase
MDGHVHITNRIYWEGIDPWQPIGVGWDYARARAAGVNCIIDILGTYGYLELQLHSEADVAAD